MRTSLIHREKPAEVYLLGCRGISQIYTITFLAIEGGIIAYPRYWMGIEAEGTQRTLGRPYLLEWRIGATAYADIGAFEPAKAWI